MKISVSLADKDLATLDTYIEQTGLSSRSAGVQHAIRMLAYPALEEDYAHAWAQWSTTPGEHDLWDNTSNDGIN